MAGRPKPPEIPAEPDKPKQPVRPSGRQRVPEHLDTDSESHRPKTCQHCGGEDLRIVGEELTHQLDTIREHLRHREIVRKRCECNRCYQTTLAEMPAMPWAKSKFTANMLAHVAYQKEARCHCGLPSCTNVESTSCCLPPSSAIPIPH